MNKKWFAAAGSAGKSCLHTCRCPAGSRPLGPSALQSGGILCPSYAPDLLGYGLLQCLRQQDDRDPRHHEFTVQLRPFDASKSGAQVGVATLIALCTSILKKCVRGGLIIEVEINLGGSIEQEHNPESIAEIAVEKGATALLMPVNCRKQLYDLSDDTATKVDIQFYSDARDALLKTMVE